MIDSESTELVTRKTIYDIFQIKQTVLTAFSEMEKQDKLINDQFKEIDQYDFYDFAVREDVHGNRNIEKVVDRKCWRYLVSLYDLHKYMLCTEYEKMKEQIEDFNTPEFTVKNAEGFLLSLKHLVYENVQKLIEDVFNRITQGTYKTGSGWNNEVKKKRNNNGIDKWFIIRTNDCYRLHYWRDQTTITDDLEKACYLIGGESLPTTTILDQMRRDKVNEAENKFFKIRVCKNGNTHYKLNDEIRKKLNFYGAKRGILGENIKIKIFDKDSRG